MKEISFGGTAVLSVLMEFNFFLQHSADIVQVARLQRVPHTPQTSLLGTDVTACQQMLASRVNAHSRHVITS